jgi:hypothetical protein
MNAFDATSDPERHHLWQRLIAVDSEAFVRGDWTMIANDFDAENFEGIRCKNSANPDDWTIFFPTLASYRDNWLRAADEFKHKKFLRHTPLEAVLARTRLDAIEINGDRALAHKKFAGDVPLADGTMLTGSRQTIYRLHKKAGRWRIVGFLGFLPLV